MENIWIWIEGNQNLLILATSLTCLLLFLLLVIQIYCQSRLRKRLKMYESGSLSQTLEQAIQGLKKDLDQTKEELKEERRKLVHVIAKERKAIKKVKLVKYNAFESQGGNVSYALALLNEENSGIIINSIHSTDFSFSYAKEVEDGHVKQIMSKEEEKVLTQAKEIK